MSRSKHKQSHPTQQSRLAKVQWQWQWFTQEHGIYGPFEYAARARAEQAARRLLQEIVATYRTYHQNVEAEATVELSRRQYEQVLDAAYPPDFWEDYKRLRAGNSAGMENAIGFLEADPMFYRSGYVKTKLLRCIKPDMISPSDAARLRGVVLSVVDRRDDRDFRAFCRLARKVDAPELRDALALRLTHGDADVRRRARWVLAALQQAR